MNSERTNMRGNAYDNITHEYSHALDLENEYIFVDKFAHSKHTITT